MRSLSGQDRQAEGGPAAAGGEPSDRGSAIIAVVAFGMLALLAVTNVIGGIVAEHRAVEDSLAQTRLYWAAMGHANYLLSRTRQSGPCDEKSNCDLKQETAKASKQWLDEIKDLEVWQYPERGSIYQFKLHPTVMADPSTYTQDKGRLMFEAHFTHSTGGKATENLQALRTALITRPVELRYCVASQYNNACGSDSGKEAKFNWIVSMHRPAVDPVEP